MQTVTACGLAEGLTAAGRTDEALVVIDRPSLIHRVAPRREDGPELLRVRAGVMLSMPKLDAEQVEASILAALACAQRQGAKGWELRATLTLAELREKQGRTARSPFPARNDLRSVHRRASTPAI